MNVAQRLSLIAYLYFQQIKFQEILSKLVFTCADSRVFGAPALLNSRYPSSTRLFNLSSLKDQTDKESVQDPVVRPTSNQ